jgi:hypothetical protein
MIGLLSLSAALNVALLYFAVRARNEAREWKELARVQFSDVGRAAISEARRGGKAKHLN